MSRRRQRIKTPVRQLLAMFVSVMVAGIVVVAPVAAAPVFAATTTDFTTPGNASYTVPAGVTAIQVDAFGAQGNGPEYGNGIPGSGGAVRAVLPVTPGQVLQMVVGQQGAGGQQGPNNYLDGGNGGGASDVRTGSCAETTSCALSDRVVVAGGGGGTGGWTTGYGNNNVYCGGGGGANPDGSGAAGCDGRAQAAHTNGGGGGGTQTAGGAGGWSDRDPAGSGTLGVGGNGGGTSTTSPPGGGGGNGYYGGGGGGGNGFYLGGRGGGGSSYVTPSALSAEFRGATRSGNGAITITTLDATSTSTTTLTSSPNPVSASSTVTFTASITPAPADGTITFTAEGASIAGCVNVAVAANTATCTTSFATIGARSIRAGFSGNASVLPSQSAALSQGVSLAATTTVTTSSSASISTGAALTYTATVTPTPTGGTVTFRSGGTPIAECTNVGLNGATATCSQTYTSTGNRTITSVFSGNADYTTSTSATFNQTVVGAATTSTLVSDANPSGLGRNVTYTVTVQPAPDAGTVAFTDNAASMTGCSAVAVNTTSGTATCRTAYTTSEPHTIVTSFSGTSNYAPSSTTLAQTVSATAASYTTPGTQLYTVPAGVTAIEVMVWGAQGNNAEYGTGSPGTGGGAKAVLAVTSGQVLQVAVGQQGAGGQQGPNNYLDGGNGGGASDIRAGVCAASGSCALTDRVVVGGGGGGVGGWATGYGNNNVYCGGNGGGNADGSSQAGCDGRAQAAHTNGGGGGGTQTAGGAGGKSDKGTAIAGVLGLGGTGGGTATTSPPGGGGGNGYYGGGGGGGGFYLGGGGGGGSSYVTPAALSEQYTSGRTGHGTVTITAIGGLPASTTSMTASSNPAVASQTVTYTAVVTPAPTAGTILFTADNAPIAGCGAVTVSAGTASCTTTFRTIGNRSVRAGFSGTATALPSRSAAVTQTVNQASSATVVTSSAASVANGAPVTYTATVAPIPTGGTVTFRSGGVDIASCVAVGVNTSTGTATCAQTYTSLGNRSITVVYSGNTDYTPSTSAAITQAVTAAATTTGVVTDQTPSGTGRGVTYTATVAAPPDGGTARFVDDGATITGCAAVAVNTTTGVATCSTSYTSPASHAITAVFSGTPNYGTSTSPTLTQVVSPGAAVYEASGSQTYKVPTGWTDIRIEAWGAEGNNPEYGTGTPGRGGGTRSTLTVTGGQILQVSVGQRGEGGQQGSNNYLDGGNGGGASDVRTGTCAATFSCALADRAIVAAGGGGNGGWTSGYGNNNVYCGGDGGANPDGSGAAGCDGRAQAPHTNGGGGGGTQTAGGAGGSSDRGPAGSGSLGVGGNGGGTSTSYPPGGGGGNGYYGGGGGGGNGFYLGGGGGGGSSYVTPSATTAAFLGSGRTGNGVVTINHAATKISVTAPSTPLTNATTRTLTATVTDTGGRTVTTGPDSALTITFTQTSGTGSVTDLGTGVAVGGVATLVVSGATPGPVSISAAATTVASTLTSTTAASFTVVQANQTITFAQPSSPATYLATFTVTPTASTGLAVTLTASGGCTATPGAGGQSEVQMTSGTTDCTLTASQPGNTGTAAAADVVRVVTTTKAGQTITFAQPVTPATYGTTFAIVPTASSGLTAAVSASVGCTIAGDVVTITSGTTACKLTATQAGDSNWAAAKPVEHVVLTTRAAQAAVTFDGPAGATYGDTVVMTATGGSGSGSWAFDIEAGSTCVETAHAATTIDLKITAGDGDCTVTAVKAGDGNFEQATATAVTAAHPATLNVRATARSKVYGASEPAYGWMYSGFVAPDTTAVVSGEAACTRDPGENAGSYTIVCAPGSLAATNYVFATGSHATMTIDPAALTITASDAAMSYLDAVPAITASYDGLAGADTAPTTPPACSTDATSTSPAGTYTSACANAADTNYTVSYVAGTVTISPAAQTITFAQPTTPATYATTFTIAPTASSGLTVDVAVAGGCTIAASTVTITSGTTACALTATQAGDSNWTAATPVEHVVGTVRATQSTVTLTAPAAASYGDTVVMTAAGGSGSGSWAFDVTAGSVCVETTHAATTIDLQITAGDGDCTVTAMKAGDENFEQASVGATTVASLATLSVNASGRLKFYGASDPTLGSTYSGFVGTDTSGVVSGDPSCTRDTGEDTGTYTIVCEPGTATADNYVFVTGTSSSLKVLPRALTITASDATMSYLDAVPTITAGYSALFNGDIAPAIPPSCATNATSTSPAGKYSSNCVSAVDDNYTIVYVEGTVTVEPAAQTITLTGAPASAVFGDVFAMTATASSGYPVTLTAANGCTSTVTADGWDIMMTSGTIACALTASQGGGNDYNAAVDVTATVSAVRANQVITLAGPPASAVFADTFDASASTTSGLPVALTATGGCTSAGKSSDTTSTWELAMTSGTSACTITVSQIGNLNYAPAPDVTTVVAAVKDAQVPVMLTGPSDGTYGDTYTYTASGGSGSGTPTFAVSGPACTLGDNDHTSADVTVTDADTVCVITITTAGDDDYTVSSDAITLSGNPRTLQVVAGDHTKIYGSTDPALTWSFTGYASGDTQATLAETGVADCLRDAGRKTGSYDITCTPGTLQADNYVFVTGPSGELTINRKDLQITASDVTWTYLDAVPQVVASFDGFANDDTSVATPPTCSTGATTASPAGTYLTSCTAAADDNYTITYTTGTATVTKATQTIAFAQPASPAAFATSFELTPTSSSRLPVTLTASGGCGAAKTAAGTTVTIVSSSNPCVLTARQAGNDNFMAASPVTHTVDVSVPTNPPTAAQLAPGTGSIVAIPAAPAAPTAPTVPSAPAAPPSGGLPVTGNDPASILLIALFMFATGVALQHSRRRRSQV